MKKYSFFFHYNKPQSKVNGRNKLSVHWKNKCYIVDKVNCYVPIISKDNKNQPYCTMNGKSRHIKFETIDSLMTANIL